MWWVLEEFGKVPASNYAAVPPCPSPSLGGRERHVFFVWVTKEFDTREIEAANPFPGGSIGHPLSFFVFSQGVHLTTKS